MNPIKELSIGYALNDAHLHVKEIIDNYPIVPHTCHNNVKNGHHSTGIRGVSVSVVKSRCGNRTPYVSIGVTDDSKHKQMSFYVSTLDRLRFHKFKAKFEKAYKYRKEFERRRGLEVVDVDLSVVERVVYHQLKVEIT